MIFLQPLILLAVLTLVTLTTIQDLKITKIALSFMSQKRRREIVAGWFLTGLAVSIMAIGASLVLYLPDSWRIGVAMMGMFGGAVFFLIAANQFIKQLSFV